MNLDELRKIAESVVYLETLTGEPTNEDDEKVADFFEVATPSTVLKLLDAVEVMIESLNEIASWCPNPNNPDDCRVAECHKVRETLSRVREILGNE